MTCRAQRAIALPLAGTLLLLAGCATSGGSGGRAAATSIPLGVSGGGDLCQAQQTSLRADAAAAAPRDADSYFDRAYVITCRNVTAARPVGAILSLVDRPEAEGLLRARYDCGAQSAVSVEGIGPVQASRCIDRQLGSASILLSFRRDGRLYAGSGDDLVLAPLENGLRAISGSAEGPRQSASVQPGSLAPAPAGAEAAMRDAGIDGAASLRRIVRLNHLGRHGEASREVNDALTRLPPGASPAIRAELRLEAALADSNIRFFNTAQSHFDQAGALLAQVSGADLAVLARKRDVYLALHNLNQSDYAQALAVLDRAVRPEERSDQPLMDSATLLRLNARPPGLRRAGGARDFSAALGATSAEDISLQMLDVQEYWVRSVAASYRARSARAPLSAEEALAQARRELDELVGSTRLEQAAIHFLRARLHRQEGRIHDLRAAQLQQQGRGAEAAAAWDQAGAALDRAEAELRLSTGAAGGTEMEPALADLQLERAMLALRPGGDPERIHALYAAAFRTTTLSGATGSVATRPIQRYLDYLVQNLDGPDRARNQERFFEAIQVSREPSVARQISLLRDVRAQGGQGESLRELNQLRSQLGGLGYQIQTLDPSDPDSPARRAAFEQQRVELQRRVDELQRQVGQSASIGSVSDMPATLAELRSVLREGELYFKLVAIGPATYGVLVSRDDAWMYRIAGEGRDSRALAEAAARIRQSIDGPGVGEDLPAFQARAAHELFTRLMGPVAPQILAASTTSIVIDPAGPLATLPAAVLVTSPEGIREGAAYDNVAFLARERPLSQAASPRSFVASRSQPASEANRDFIGFSSPSDPAPAISAVGDLRLGSSCRLSGQSLLNFHQSFGEISDREVPLSVAALGTRDAEIVAQSAFTEDAVRARRLADFRVLHFATHGFGENTVRDCRSSPPGLLTSLTDTSSDGILSFEEIAALSLDANLVVLSACDTSRGVLDETLARAAGQETGATLEGLVRAFLTSGSRAVMATYWQISDEQETLDLMQDFYRAGRDQPIDVALQTAQRRLMTNPRYSHPFFWAPFFIVGDSRNHLLAGGSQAQARSGAAASAGSR
jgi:CHAT domain-containing protein